MPSPLDRLLSDLSYLPRVGKHDGLAIENALQGATLLDEGVSLTGAIVEASYAAKDPPIVRRLASERVPYLMDLHSLRFAGEAYLEVQQIADLDFAPRSPIQAHAMNAAAARALVDPSLRFTQAARAAAYTTPGLPLYDHDLPEWIDANRHITEVACDRNGTGDVERRPLIAIVAPGRKAMRTPELMLDWLIDLPIDAIYLQPLNLNPVRDSFEKLALYVAYAAACQEAGLRVIAGRVGAFGLLLQALLGISAFDSGLGDAETFALSTQVRRSKPRDDRKPGGRNRRIYFEPIKTTLQSKHAMPLLEDHSVRHRLTCELGCCRYRGFEDLADRRRAHYLWTRTAEVSRLRDRPAALHRTLMQEQLATAREHARVIRRTLFAAQVRPPSFEHLDRWLGLLTQDVELRLSA